MDGIKQAEESIDPGKLQFICSQDDVPEQELKKCLLHLFEKLNGVQKAYLVRVQYDSSSELSVALCLCASSVVEKEVVEAIFSVFSSMFSSSQYMDIIFLNDQQKLKISKVCHPFFIRESQKF